MTQPRFNGKFIRKDNPIAVIGNANARLTRDRDRAAAAELSRRHARTPGPLTRNELAALAIAATVEE